jgi:hypothetical protein
MRPGLLIGGIAMVALAAAILVTAGLVPAATNVLDSSGVIVSHFYHEDEPVSEWVPGLNATSGILDIRWNGTGTFNVSLYRAGGCRLSDLSCVVSDRVDGWDSSPAGEYRVTGSILYPYYLVYTPLTASNGTFNVTVLSANNDAVGLPLLTFILIAAGSIVLMAIGGMGIFLGLFLRGGVYGRRPPLVSQHPDDAAWIADEQVQAADEPGAH